MRTCIRIPASPNQAACAIRSVICLDPARLSRPRFVATWCSVAYLLPGLHPDNCAVRDGGWPRALRPLLEEAWRRFAAGTITDEELYPSDAQWAGLHDRLIRQTVAETRRRRRLDLEYGPLQP